MCFSLGFEMSCPPATPMGPSKNTFGYLGAGGSIAFADPKIKMGFGYSHNFMHMGIGPGPCGLPLVEETIAICTAEPCIYSDIHRHEIFCFQ